MSIKKYQVFVSSTYEDLKAERDQVIKAVLEMGHIPVGMEMFSAADEEQWRIITRQIDQSDFYAVIVAHRYGSVVDGVSFTEREYDYAVAEGIPVLGFVIDQKAAWRGHLFEADPEKRDALERFKAKVRKKPVGFWTDAQQLHGLFSIALTKAILTSDRQGWVRGGEVSESTQPELEQLRKVVARLALENENLRQRLQAAGHGSDDPAAAIIRLLRSRAERFDVSASNEQSWHRVSASWYDVFAALRMTGKDWYSAGELRDAFGSDVTGRSGRAFNVIPADRFLSVVAALSEAGLMKPKFGGDPRSPAERWTLTDLGQQVADLSTPWGTDDTLEDVLDDSEEPPLRDWD